MTYSANIEDVLAILNDEEAGVEWEEAWDTLDEFDESDSHLVGILREVLASETDTERRDNCQRLRKVWCIRAVSKIGAVDECLQVLRLQILSREKDVPVAALAALRRSKKPQEIVEVLVEAFRFWRGWPIFRCRIFLTLLAILRDPFRAVRLIKATDRNENWNQ